MDETSSVSTFLFTDIEGSTSMWEAQPEQMAQAVARHDALLREAVQAHQGRVVKTTGDGVYAAFGDAADGLAAVIDIQLALIDPAATAGMGLRVRCGLHAGAVHERDNDYFGSTINRTARVMGAAHGGQILVSQAVADRVRDRLPGGVELRDLGSVRLKGLASSETVHQVVHPKLYQNFPALRELEATPNNLPQQLTSFVGRERDCEEAGALLQTTRLLTLLGMGGLGKTRLSLQVGTDVMDAYPDGVWFVDLAPIRDPTLVPGETAQVLAVREEPGRPLLQTLCAHVATRRLLLILDNCEHLIGASASLVNALLRAAPGLRVLATSREALRIPGEQVYPVLPLAVPERAASFEAMSRSPAVQLFVDRARQHKPGFELTERDAPAVAELVARLEGIPLALELAAARVRALSVSDINARLKDRYKLLTGGGRVLLERQQTLRALVDWSYDLLNENEQLLLARLFVFAGGFTLEAAEGVCGDEPLTPDDVLDLLTSFVEKSLIMVEERDEGTRYRMLETIRDYAREKLIARNELPAVAARHCDHFLIFAKASNMGLQGADQAAWTRRVEAELDNLRAATALALEKGVDPVIAVKYSVALLGFWMLRGYSTEGRRYVRTALALPEVRASAVALAHALYVGAALADGQGDHGEAQRMLEECLSIRRDLGSAVDIAAALSTLSSVCLHGGDATRARTNEQEAVEIFRQIGNRIGEAIGLLHLGHIDAYVENDGQARRHFEDCLAIARSIKHQEIESEGELMLGELEFAAGDLAAARKRFERSLSVCQDAEDRRGEATALWWMGKTDLASGDIDAARVRLGGALRAFQSFEMNGEILGCLEDHAELFHRSGVAEHAARVYAAAASARERLTLMRSPRDESRWQVGMSATKASLPDTVLEAAWRDGRAWGLDEAIRRALTHVAAEMEALAA